MYSRISGTGRYLPEHVLAMSDRVFRERTGIKQCHVAAEGETTADLAEAAARNALELAGVEPENVDLLIVGTTTPDIVFPNLGCLLQERLGIPDGPAFSLEASSSGFTYGLSVADRYVVSGESRYALVIGAETLSRISGSAVGPDESATVFADGAGAVLLEPAESPGLIACRLGADTLTGGNGADQVLQITGLADLDVNLNNMRNAVVSLLTEQNLKIGAVDWLVPHQSSLEIIERTADSLGISRDKTVLTLAEHGNTGAASVPIALDIAVKDGRIRRGDLLLLETVGGGFTWGSALARF